MEPIYNNFNTSLRKKLGTTQKTNEVRLNALSEKPIIKVIGAWATPFITNTELNSSGVESKGITKISAVYETTDGELVTINEQLEFDDMLAISNIDSNTTVFGNACILDVNVESDAQQMKLNILIEITYCAITSEETKVLVGAENCFVQTEEIKTSSIKCKINQNYTSSVMLDLKETPINYLSVYANAIAENVYAAKGYVTVSGTIVYGVCYEVLKEDGKDIKYFNGTYTYKYEIDCDNVEPKDMACVKSIIQPNSVRVVTNENNELSLESEINFSGFVLHETSNYIVSDLFALDNKLQLTYTTLISSQLIDRKNFESQISGTVTISGDQFRVEKILGTLNTNFVVTKSILENDNLIIEGILQTNILYLNADEVLEGGMQLEVPFATTFKVDEELTKTDICLNYLPVNVTTKIRRGREIDIDGEMKFSVAFFRTDTETVITEVECAEEKCKPENALTIYIVKDNDTIWRIAKKLNVSPEMLIEQNPTLADGVVKGDKIIVYRKR